MSQYKNDEKLYKKFPLHKSHANHGFEEPLIYFVPSIGISQVVQIPKKFFIFSSAYIPF